MSGPSTMPAGRELDERIALDVMKWKRDSEIGWFTQPGHIPRTPKFSTSIAAAWEVVERLAETGFDVRMQRYGAGQVCEVDLIFDGHFYDTVEAPTMPLAVCRAALDAVKGPDHE